MVIIHVCLSVNKANQIKSCMFIFSMTWHEIIYSMLLNRSANWPWGKKILAPATHPLMLIKPSVIFPILFSLVDGKKKKRLKSGISTNGTSFFLLFYITNDASGLIVIICSCWKGILLITLVIDRTEWLCSGYFFSILPNGNQTGEIQISGCHIFSGCDFL